MLGIGLGAVALLTIWYPAELVVIAALYLELVSSYYTCGDSYIRRARCANRSCICFLFFASRTFLHSSSLGSVLRTMLWYYAVSSVAGMTCLCWSVRLNKSWLEWFDKASIMLTNGSIGNRSLRQLAQASHKKPLYWRTGELITEVYIMHDWSLKFLRTLFCKSVAYRIELQKINCGCFSYLLNKNEHILFWKPHTQS